MSMGAKRCPHPLSKSEENILIKRLAGGESEVKSSLIERNIRLVVYIARKFDNTGVGLEDLISHRHDWLIKAVNTFDASKNIKLATYASRCIEIEILMFLRRTSQQKEKFLWMSRSMWIGMAIELLLSDILGTESDAVFREIENDVEKSLIAEAVSHLPDREKLIINMRFGLSGFRENTQKQVADALGISQSYISRLEKRIIRRLQKDVAKML